jgi:hypothetical protein
VTSVRSFQWCVLRFRALLDIYIYVNLNKSHPLTTMFLLGRNGILATKNRLQNAFGTQILCTISLAVIMRPSMSFPPSFVPGQCHADCDIFHKRNFTFDDVHVKGAGRIAKVSASVGVPRLVHVSHLNATPSSTSQFYRSKAAGETAVRGAFPAATIVRPGPMYGHEDKFLTNMPCMSSLLFVLQSSP